MIEFFIGSEDASSPIHLGCGRRNLHFCFNNSKSSQASTEKQLSTSGANSPATLGDSSPLNYSGTQITLGANANLTLPTDQGTVDGAFNAVDQAIQTVEDTSTASSNAVTAALTQVLANQANQQSGGQTSANQTVLMVIIALALAAVSSVFFIFGGRKKEA